jgi:hypothetical protein
MAFVPHHHEWQPGQAEIAAVGGADRRSAKNASAGMNQSREAHHSARPLHSPLGGHDQGEPTARADYRGPLKPTANARLR